MDLTLYSGDPADIAETISDSHDAGVVCTFQLYTDWADDEAANDVFVDAGLRAALFAEIKTVLDLGFDGVNFDWETDNR
jgi:hypothetical protein